MTTTEPVPADDLDPFDAFNLANGAGGEDPYPAFAAARARGPILDGVGVEMGLMGDEGSMEALDGVELPTLFTAYSYDAVQQVLRNGTDFSSAHYGMVIGMVFGRSILEMDEPEHHLYRSLIQQAFTRKSMERWEHDLVRPIVNGLIDEFIGDGRADLVRALTFPFPMTVIAGLLGLPDERLEEFHRLGIQAISVGFDFELALRASTSLRDLFADLLADRRAAMDPLAPAADIISVLAAAELDGQKLTDEDIFAFLRLLLPAGAETTYRSSSNLLCGLLTHTDQLDALRADRSLLPQAIEEGLRWETPLLMIARMAKNDTEVCGRPVPTGSVVMTILGSANHDESRWDRPEAFDIFRTPKPHASFAFGPHTCLGMHLARMETTVVVNALLDRLPNLRLDPDAPTPTVTGTLFRAPLTLPVVWDT